MKFKLVFFSILSLSHFSCKKKISIPQAKLSELNEMEAFWNSKGLDSYTVTQKMNCYCAYESTLPQEVTVRNGIIESVGGVPYDPSRHSRFFTIKESFEFIRKRIKRKPVGSHVSYDLTYGYPTNFYFKMNPHMADEGIGYSFSSFILN